MSNIAFRETGITKINPAGSSALVDRLAVEEPLEIRLQIHSPEGVITKNVSVTMCTPGHEKELAAGFLFTEKIIAGIEQVQAIILPDDGSNTVTVQLFPGIAPDLKKMDRHFYTTSSCGVCGKASIEALGISSVQKPGDNNIKIGTEIFYTLNSKLRQAQPVFDFTGGLHAAALFDEKGNLLALQEDVGRHNALDKLIGYAVLNKLLPLDNHILMLSGRASFELLQKAGIAGIKFVAAVGAPSSLAVQTAQEFGITLIGFLRSNGFNIYSYPENIEVSC
jgi:FdhD protein